MELPYIVLLLLTVLLKIIYDTVPVSFTFLFCIILDHGLGSL